MALIMMPHRLRTVVFCLIVGALTVVLCLWESHNITREKLVESWTRSYPPSARSSILVQPSDAWSPAIGQDPKPWESENREEIRRLLGCMHSGSCFPNQASSAHDCENIPITVIYLLQHKGKASFDERTVRSLTLRLQSSFLFPIIFDPLCSNMDFQRRISGTRRWFSFPVQSA
jgi:hypothetical protein